MTPGPDDRNDETRSVWTVDQEIGTTTFDENCSPTRVCRNAREFGFEEIAADGGDVGSAWREKLAREGKLDRSAPSIRDLVLGPIPTD